MIYRQIGYRYGETIFKPEMTEGNPIRLYSLDEIKSVFHNLGMSVYDSYADYNGTLSSDNNIQIMVCSKKM